MKKNHVLLVPQVFQKVKKDKALLKPNQAPYQVQVKIKWIQEIRKNQENQDKDKVNHNHKDRVTLKEMLLDKDKVKQENHKALEVENRQEKDKALVMEKVKEKAKVRDKVQVHQVLGLLRQEPLVLLLTLQFMQQVTLDELL